MKNKLILTITAIIFLLSGFGFLLFPGLMMTPFGIEASEQLKNNEQLYGISLISMAVLAWTSRKSVHEGWQRSTNLTLFVYCILGMVVTLVHQMKEMANSAGWGIVILHTIFAGFYGYFLINRN